MNFLNKAQEDVFFGLLRKHGLSIKQIKAYEGQSDEMKARIRLFHKELDNRSILLSYPYQADILGMDESDIQSRIAKGHQDSINLSL